MLLDHGSGPAHSLGKVRAVLLVFKLVEGNWGIHQWDSCEFKINVLE